MDAPAPDPVQAQSWLDTFHSFSLPHAIVVLAFILATGASCVLGRRWRGRPAERMLRLAWAWTTIAWQSAAVVWWLLPRNFDLYESLPIHVCDLAAWIAPLALLTQRRWLRTMLYFWGIGLSTQAFLTPVLQEGPTYLKFWLFWVGHTQIVGSAVYDLVVLRYRPTRRDFITAFTISLVYILAALAFNIAMHTNYAYVGNSAPDRPTIIDALGRWPLRVLWLSMIVTVLFLVLWLIWPAARRAFGLPPGATLDPDPPPLRPSPESPSATDAQPAP
ncbi:MAG: TIGR02206 family membrane protein [Phycisphaerales bacterium]|jgi:hypothetical integral membrane protein (TIGR02206 family)|nr:TIGR02206 family membrane protein [Phycisphaerales bacterium]